MENTTIILIVILLILPIILVLGGIYAWNNHSKKLTQKERENLIAKITITGSIVTIVAVVYSIILTLYRK